jgi:acetyltransferase-like isoleucine patch superfamily enzyme
VTLDRTVRVHPAGLCESSEVGPRTRIWAFAHVLPGAVVGADCNICDHAFVETGARVGDRVTVKNAVLIWDGVTIEDDVFIGPNVVFTNDLNPRAHVTKGRDRFVPTVVRRGATIGANATVVCGVTHRRPRLRRRGRRGHEGCARPRAGGGQSGAPPRLGVHLRGAAPGERRLPRVRRSVGAIGRGIHDRLNQR